PEVASVAKDEVLQAALYSTVNIVATQVMRPDAVSTIPSTDDPMPAPPEHRLVSLELLVTHLERDLGAMNSVVLEQQREIESLKHLVSRLDDRMTRLAEEEEPRDPQEERPPHY